MHRLMEEIVSGKILGVSIPEPERTYIERCLNFLADKREEGVPFDTEKRLFVLGPRGLLLASCRADLFGHIPELTIYDWKFYREPLEEREWEWQARVMAVAALQEHPGEDVCWAVAYLPVLDRTYERVFYRADLEKHLGQIASAHYAANLPVPRLIPGAWCARCRALASCPAAQEALMDLAKDMNLESIRTQRPIPTVSRQRTVLYGEIETWSRGRFQGAVELLPFLPALVDAIRLRLRRELAEGLIHTQYELKPKALPRKGEVRDVRKALLDYLSPEEIDGCLVPSFTRLDAALKKKGYSGEQIRRLLERFIPGETNELRRVK